MATGSAGRTRAACSRLLTSNSNDSLMTASESSTIRPTLSRSDRKSFCILAVSQLGSSKDQQSLHRRRVAFVFSFEHERRYSSSPSRPFCAHAIDSTTVRIIIISYILLGFREFRFEAPGIHLGHLL